MLGPWVAALLAVPCAGIAVHPDPMSMERGSVSSNGSLHNELAAMSAQAAALEAKMEAQAGECKKEKPTDRAPSGSANAGVFNRPWTKDMHMLRDSKLWGMRQPSAVPQPGEDVKLALLMFANDRIDNEEIWLHWMEEGRKAGLDFQMYIHAYGLPPRGNAQWRSEKFKQYLVNEQARSTWCQMWEAQMVLIKRALLDTRTTHLVMLSSDSVPVKPMGWIYNQTRDQPLSRFCVDDFWRDPWPRAETWSLLRRGDAHFFVDNEEFAESHLRRDCEEELAWYFPLRVRWDNFNDKAPLKRECIMFTNWKDGEKACKEAWAENAEKCNCPTLRKTKNSTAANFKHPVVYHGVTADAYEELVRSPYWFARKFSEDGVPGHLATVMDIDITKPKKKKKLLGIFR